MGKDKDIQYVEALGIVGRRPGLNDEQTLELNILRINGGRPMFDLRWWSEGRPRYGVVLTEKSLAELGELIDIYFREHYDKAKGIYPKRQQRSDI
jgi:hypothetical protein